VGAVLLVMTADRLYWGQWFRPGIRIHVSIVPPYDPTPIARGGTARSVDAIARLPAPEAPMLRHRRSSGPGTAARAFGASTRIGSSAGKPRV
jgi:hypothetical protein